MKVKVEIDLSAKEAREMMGLPDMEPIYEAMAGEMKVRMKKAASQLEPEMLVKSFLPTGQAGMEQFQNFMWGAAKAAAGVARGAASKTTKTTKTTKKS